MELPDERGVALLQHGRFGWPWVEAVAAADDAGTPVARAAAE